LDSKEITLARPDAAHLYKLMIPTLTAIAGPVTGTVFSLVNPSATAGRLPDNQIALADPLVSRQHCQFTWVDGQVTLKDLSSNNGTFVNGLLVQERTLAHGDLIKVGETLLLLACQADETAAQTTALATGSGVKFEELQLATQATLTLDCNDSPYLDLEKLLAKAPVTARLAREFQALLRVGMELNTLQNVTALQQHLLKLLGGVVPAERGAILLLDEGQGEFISAFGWERAGQHNQDVHVSRTLVQQVLREGVALWCNDVPAQAEFQSAESLLFAGVQSIIAAPLMSGAHVFGVIYLDARRQETDLNAPPLFDQAHVQLVTALANLSAPVFARVREREQYERERQERLAQVTSGQNLIGASEHLLRVREFITKIAPANATVLLRGESGTGKEVVAKALHSQSPRASKMFQAVNCAAMPEALLESELFGHEKGAFTNALSQKKGKLEIANGGTVFLDEIGDLALTLQAKLLRVLQEKEFQRVGGLQTHKLDIRVVAATNCNLESAIQAGRFRQDLYYRLNVCELMLAPLRERRADIGPLANHFLHKFAQETGKRIKAFSATARQCLLDYNWPGNVRELQNAIERAVTWCETDYILPEDLPEPVAEALIVTEPRKALPPSSNPAPASHTPPSPATTNYNAAVKEARQQIILNAFALAAGNHHEAAKLLGLHPNNLHRELRRLNLRDLLKNG
jgi:transcriptional regulator with GAF, ATPase, and Fis domain